METYKIGKSPTQWSENAQTITFIVTEDCNLRCKYCYITHKASNKKMNFETAKKFIDYILTANINIADDVIIEFFGGEPMIEMDLVDKISDYFKLKSYELNHPWSWRYRFNFATNGVNYSSPAVQKYIKKNYGKLSIGISIDGTKEKHDLNRVFPDGSGSYETIEKNIPLWISQFSPATKMTFASEDLKYLKDSVINLWEHGVTDVSSNVVFENVWKDGDDILFEKQLKELADYILDNKLFDKYYCTFFSDTIGGYATEEMLDSTFCGAGKMMALAPNGNIYPCVRYKDYSLNNHPERIIGTVDTGINFDLVRAFMVASSRYQDDSECLNCPIAAGCPQCQGFSYDEAETCTNFQRAKYICKMQKARVRANDYFFSKLFNNYGIKREHEPNYPKMYFLLSDSFTTYCCYKNNDAGSNVKMSFEKIKQGLEFCSNNFYKPIFVHADDSFLDSQIYNNLDQYNIIHIVPVSLWKHAEKLKNVLFVYDEDSIEEGPLESENCIYNIDQDNISILSENIITLFSRVNRINVNILNLNKGLNEKVYVDQLQRIKEYILDLWKKGIKNKEINILTDILNSNDWCNCQAGDKSFVLAPNAKIYACPSFYKKDINSFIGDLDSGINNLKNAKLYKKEYHPICQVCDTKHCRICLYHNLIGTNEINVSPSYQCRKSYLERMISVELSQAICELSNTECSLVPVDYFDPATRVPTINQKNIGYYKI